MKLFTLDHALALGHQLLGRVDALALQLDFSDLGAIDLPPLLQPAADQAHLQTIPPLYLAAELEAARLLPAVETLAGLFVSGAIRGELGAASAMLVDFWRTRQQRLNESERRAIFARLFGSSAGPSLAMAGANNLYFEALLIDLAEALFKLDPAPSTGSRLNREVPLRLAAARLASNAIARSDGLAAYVARDLLNTIERALQILKVRELQRTMGATSVWSTVTAITERYLHQQVDVAAHVVRAKSGMQILSWLAEVLPRLEESSTLLASPDDPVVAAAGAWLEASLTLAEVETAPRVPSPLMIAA